jgi:hypothetical protein
MSVPLLPRNTKSSASLCRIFLLWLTPPERIYRDPEIASRITFMAQDLFKPRHLKDADVYLVQ